MVSFSRRPPRRPVHHSSYDDPNGSDPSRRSPGGNAAAAAARAADRYDPVGATNDLLDEISAAYDDELAALDAEFRGSYYGGGGGGGGGYGDAIAEAQKILDDVLGNRAEIANVYDEYSAFVDPISQEAIDAAAEIVEKGKPALAKIAANAKSSIRKTYDQADDTVDAEAKLIGAGGAANKAVMRDIEGEALRIANAIQEAAGASDMLRRGQTAASTMAAAQRDLDKGDVTREEEYLDLEFAEMEKLAKENLAAARAAAAAAAASGARRRGAMAADHNAALAELENERYMAMRLNPHEAGEATALAYLRNNGADLDYNRQQLVVSTVSNAISQQVRSNNIARWAADQGVRLSPDEVRLVSGGVSAYSAGMRHQQQKDYSNIQYGTDASGQANAFRPRNTR